MDYLIIFAKLLASSAMLLAFFQLVLRKRATYKLMRLYLIMIPFVSMVMSGFSFEIYKPNPKVIEIEQEAMLVHGKPYPVSLESHNTVTSHKTIKQQTNLFSEFGYVDYAIHIILAVSAILLLVMFFYILKMSIISRKMKAEKTSDGFKLIRSGEVNTPFSFYETIFMPANMETERENLILLHEKAHVVNKHYIDVWIIELMVRILWFNPIMWVVRNQLRNVHEYEADRLVLNSGADILRYQTILLEEVAEDSVIVANGFNHSFIRRRFIEMKNSTAGTLGKLGKMSTGIWVLLMFCVFTFTIGEAETIYKKKYRIPELHTIAPKEEVMPMTETDNPSAEEETIEEIDDDKATNSAIEHKDKNDAVEYASDGYPYVDDIPLNTNKSIQYSGFTIKRTPSETLVTCVGTCETDDDWFWFGGDQTYIEDAETGTHYKARRCTTPLCWNSFHVRNHKGKTFAITMVFPPIAENVKYIKLWHLCSWIHVNDRILTLKDYETK